MLQRLLLITLTICSLSASAQWQQTGSKVRYVNGLGIPTKDTAAGVSADSSQIVIRPADSSLYVKYKRTWLRVGGGAGGGSIGGSGTTNYVPKFTSASIIGNSQIFDNGTNVGIGTTSPAQKFHIAGDVFRHNDASNSYGYTISATSATTTLATLFGGSSFGIRTGGSGTDNLRIDASGNVGIGTASPAAKLSVQGTTLINTNTDNGVDKLQVSGSASISTNLSFGGQLIGTSDNTEQFVIKRATNTNQQLILGRLTGYSYLTSITQGTGYNPISLNPNGGNTLVGTTTDNGVDKLQVSGSIYSSTTLKGNDISIVATGSIPILTSTQFLTQSFSAQTNAKTANYTTAFNDYFIDCTSGTFTVTLQAAASYQGRVLIIKNSGAGTITVDGNASETIDGAATYAISVQYGTIQIVSDGANWKIISKF
jgi:hypothetical protein